MKTLELRELNQIEMGQRITDLKLTMEKLRDEVMAGKEKDQTKIRRLRREIAQALTVLRERDLAQAREDKSA